ncbi:MAG: hypothetical protein K8I27_15420 [Planctomycetes bacterium]|nr:hypothetical protein [Planctomycetota bacterium]
MSDREQLELLASRHFDGDLSAGEQARLDDALANDAGLRELHAELERVHNSVSLLAEARLPHGFASGILAALPDDAPVIRLAPRGWQHWAAAAAAVLVFGVLFAALVTNNGGTGYTPIAGNPQPGGQGVGPAVPEDTPYAGPKANVLVYSDGELELAGQRTRRFQGDVKLPAEIAAPADTHAVIEVGGGTAVLSPGSRARLADVDADGFADIEPVDGDVYLESSNGFRGRVGDVRMNVRGGVMLHRTPQGYRAIPSHGGMNLGEVSLKYRECALIGSDGILVEPCEIQRLDDWAIRGRADAIKEELKRILGAEYNSIPTEHWQQFDRLLRGVLSRPAERAASAYMLRFLLKYNFIEEATPAQRDAWGAIAGILAEGTTEADIPVQMLEMIQKFEERFDEDPEALEQFKRLVRESIEAMAEHQPD